MAKNIDRRCTGDAEVSKQLQDDEQKEQTEEFQELQEGNDRYLLIENSYGGELLRKMRTSLSHLINPENVLLCIPKYDSRVLARRDFQEIRCVTERKGDIAGAQCLLDHLERYRGWLPCLLKVLRDPMVLQDYVADDIEKTIEILQEEKKKQASVVQERADGTYKIAKKTEGAENMYLHEKTSIFGAGESTRGHKMLVFRESVLGQSHSQPLLHQISVEKTTIVDPSLYTYETERRPSSFPLMDLPDDKLRKLGILATETSTDMASFDLPHGLLRRTVSDGYSGDIYTQRSADVPVSSFMPSTSRKTQEKTTASDHTRDMRPADSYDVRKNMPRQWSTTENKRQIDILLVGKTGNGKSSVGNSILFKKAFEKSNNKDSCTSAAQFDYSEFNDVIFKVVDGPGFEDTKFDREKAFNLVLDTVSEAISVNVEGFHAILVVIPYVGKFTEEDVMTLKNMKVIFGEGFIKDHAILVMTYGDNFYKDMEETNDTFEQWCKRQTGVFKILLAEVENRIVLFDNTSKDECIRYEQVQRLVDVIDGLSNTGKRYNNENFEEAKRLRDQTTAECETQSLNYDSALREIALFLQRYHMIRFDDVEEAYGGLKSLLKSAQKLKERIKEQDRKTGVPSEESITLLTFAENWERYIGEDIESLLSIIDHRQEKNESLTRDWQHEEEASDMEKEKKGKGKESKWKSKEQSKQIEDEKKAKVEQQDHKRKKQTEIKSNEQEQIAHREALKKKRKEKDSQWSSKWKEGKQQKAAQLMEKEETRRQTKQRERDGNSQKEFEEDSTQLQFKRKQLMFENLGQRDSQRQIEQNYFDTAGREELERQRFVKKNQSGMAEWKGPIEEEHLQKQEGAKSEKQMAQPKMLAPEQHVQKGDEPTKAETIHEQEIRRVKLRQEGNQQTLEGNTLKLIRQIQELKGKELSPDRREKLKMLQGEHTKKAEQMEEGYRSMKNERTSVLRKMRDSVRRLFSWLGSVGTTRSRSKQYYFNNPKSGDS